MMKSLKKTALRVVAHTQSYPPAFYLALSTMFFMAMLVGFTLSLRPFFVS